MKNPEINKKKKIEINVERAPESIHPKRPTLI